MIPTQTVEELLSIAHVSAIVATAGATPDPVAHDFGVDLGVRRIGNFNGRRIDLGAIIDFQLKATLNWSYDKDHVIYDMKSDAYNRLITRNKNSHTPCLLILCCLDPEKSKWLSVSEKRLALKRCCYYSEISGTETKNKSTIRIRIPRNQLLTPPTIVQLIDNQVAGSTP